jgi:hypothetical protein
VRQMARERKLDRALQLLDAHRDLHEDAGPAVNPADIARLPKSASR